MSEKTNLYKSLLSAKKEMEAITKDSKNPFFKSNYFDINKLLFEVEPIMQKHGLLILQPIENGICKTNIVHVETGESVSCEIALGEFRDPQKMGSAITYYRRYTLQSLLALQAEDDDGNLAAKKTEPPKKTEPKKKLTEEAFKNLIESKNKEHILAALKFREMNKTQRDSLNKLLSE